MEPKEVIAINGWAQEGTYDLEGMALLIELYRGIAQEYCNNVFESGSEPMSVKKFIAASIKHGSNEGLQARSMGSVSYTFTPDLPKQLYSLLDPYKRLRW